MTKDNNVVSNGGIRSQDEIYQQYVKLVRFYQSKDTPSHPVTVGRLRVAIDILGWVMNKYKEFPYTYPEITQNKDGKE